MARIFIAYARKYHLFATRLAQSLSDVGADVWIDIEHIPAGAKWHNAIQDGLKQCEVLLLIVTPESMESQNVEDEWRYFRDKQKPIIPVLYKPAEVHYQLASLQYVDFQNQDYATAFAQLHTELRRLRFDLEPIATAEQAPIPAQKPLPVRGRRRINWNQVVALLVIPLFIALISALAQTWPEILRLVNGSASAESLTEAPPAIVDNSTPDIDATVRARQTQNAQATQASIPTLTPSITPDLNATIEARIVATDMALTDIADPYGAAIRRASEYSVTNASWRPFVHVFPDDETQTEMVLVPAGCFMMGSEDGSDDEQPLNQVCFDEPFWVDRYEVTNAQYGSEGAWSGDDLPRDSVDWFAAKAYCESRGARLLTEAEWEYAARGPDNLTYPWGNDWQPQKVVWNDDNTSQTRVVGMHPAGVSWVGAFDMSGNAAEWVSSEYVDYPYDPDDGREGKLDENGISRVLRGGSWKSTSRQVRTTARAHQECHCEFDFNGIRCGRSLEELAS
ncbi:MAG: hypothetical protein CL610_21125 [Anaerolineaceae bacterium]|nr:hypothetical protein [Anaerolineaceae bacterium]